MAQRGSPASGSLAQTRAPAPPAERRAALPARSALAALGLAAATLAGLVSAFVALAPLALRRRPSRSRAAADDASRELDAAPASPEQPPP